MMKTVATRKIGARKRLRTTVSIMSVIVALPARVSRTHESMMSVARRSRQPTM